MELPTSGKDYYDELADGIYALEKVIKSHKNSLNVEIELRIGQIIENKFKSGLGSEEFYNKIKELLESNKNWDRIVRTKTDELNNNGIRKITHFNGKKVPKQSCIQKTRIKTINLKYTNCPYDIRISVAREVDSEEKIKTGTLRKKERDSYYYNNFRFDLTKVIQTENTVVSTNYEFEIEFLNLKNDVSDIYRAHSALLKMRDIINNCEKIEDAKLEIDLDTELKGLSI